MLQLIGRLHPVLVHLPIGILLLACIFIWQSRKIRYAHLGPAINLMLLLGMISALVSCITGYVLAQSGDYDEGPVNFHQCMGIGVALISMLLYYLHKTKRFRRWQLSLAWLLVFQLFVTGHLGGSLTHGSDYLSGPLKQIFTGDSSNNFHRKPIADIQAAEVFDDVIRPIFQEKCVSCHGPSKQKGKLRLDDSVGIVRGGKDAELIIPGRPEQSLLIKRILLPKEDSHHMAPEEKVQLSEAEIGLLKWWIGQGAPFSKQVKSINQPDAVKEDLLALQGPSAEKKQELDLPMGDVDAADERALTQLKDSAVVVLPVAQGSHWLSANYITARKNDETIALLLRVKKQIVWLKLSQFPLDDGDMKVLGQLDSLKGLDISHCPVDDQQLAHLKGLNGLRWLNLFDTKITDKGLESLKDLKRLKTLYIFHTGVHFSEIKKLFPNCSVDTGGYVVPLLQQDTTIVKAPVQKN